MFEQEEASGAGGRCLEGRGALDAVELGMGCPTGRGK